MGQFLPVVHVLQVFPDHHRHLQVQLVLVVLVHLEVPIIIQNIIKVTVCTVNTPFVWQYSSEVLLL